MTLLEAARGLRERRFSSIELTRSALAAIDRLNPTLNAFLTVLGPDAEARAAEADRELAAGKDRGPLQGIPIALKDLFHMRGVRTTGGSKVCDCVAEANAAVVDRLEAAGAVILGKLNLHELAYGITSDNPHFGPVRNPWNPEHMAGGSSGGSGAAVARDMIFAALGTDTGGSIRVPAAFCGTVGLKPTFGLVSRFGVLPLGYSLDHVGPFTRAVRDAGAVMNVIAGFDSRDAGSVAHPVENYVPEAGCSIEGLRVGVSEEFFLARLDEDVERAVRSALDRAAGLGALLIPIRLPDMEAINVVGQVVLLAEAAAVYERDLEYPEHFGADVRALLEQGLLLPAADYIQAQRLRRKLQLDFHGIWREVECLIGPTAPIPAPALKQRTVRIQDREEEVRRAATRFTRSLNVLGLPALSMPCGLSKTGLPVGLQIIGPPFADALVLRVGAALEDAGVTIPSCGC